MRYCRLRLGSRAAPSRPDLGQPIAADLSGAAANRGGHGPYGGTGATNGRTGAYVERNWSNQWKYWSICGGEHDSKISSISRVNDYPILLSVFWFI